ncbi:retrovirus-related pol polyprotein from transposon TNT 1-94 [Tanacetum coccineum]
MDLCGLMRVESINRKKYILVIVDDYSQFTRVKFLRSKDEAPKFIIKFLKVIQVCLNATVKNIRTDNGTEFVNQTLRSYYEDVDISYETSVAQAVATTCYTQNRSLIRLRHIKTPYELLHDRKLDISYLHVFGALCYPTNDSEDLGKLETKVDVGPALHEMTPRTLSSGLVPQPPSLSPFVPPTRIDWDTLFQPLFDEYFNPPPCVDHPVLEVAAPEPTVSTDTPSSTSVDQDEPSPSTLQTPHESPSQVIPPSVEEADHDIEVAHMDNNPYFGLPILEPSSKESSSQVVTPNNVHLVNQPPEHISKWTKDHPIDNSYKEELTKSCWIEAMQEELNEFECLEVWELVPRPDRLKKALYGLKQAPRAWYDLLSSFLLSQKFSKGTVDPTLFIIREGKDILLVQIYVDDIIFASTKPDLCEKISEVMCSKFKMSMMGKLSFFLGL